MRLLKGSFKNFCSYPSLEFDFSNLGLTLVSGPTGSGKSTLMDAAAWTLFGQTSKEGVADEVKAWGADGPTTGTQEVETPQGALTVYRTRGRAQQNDLYWIEAKQSETKIRGKDATETQRLLEDRLGVTAELYFTAAYFHQFSKADAFFISKAKDRRDLLEKIADLSLPIRIADGAKSARKESNDRVAKAQSECDKLTGRLEALVSECERTERLLAAWSGERAETIAKVSALGDGFEAEKRARLGECNTKLRTLRSRLHEIEKNKKERQEVEACRPILEKAQKDLFRIEADLKVMIQEREKFSQNTETCPTCLGSYNNPNKSAHLAFVSDKMILLSAKALAPKEAVVRYTKYLGLLPALNAEYESLLASQREQEKLQFEYDRVEQSVNIYSAELNRLKAEKNPYEETLTRTNGELEETATRHESATKEVEELEKRVAYLTQVYDLSMELRGLLLEKTIRELEAKTNANLETYFDGEIKVVFTLDGDKLEAAIQKNGYDASFRQLSGGQRAILKISFGVALMEAAANKAGMHFNCLMFDEALNGLDDNLKVKAFNLFQKLETNHESVIMIDHSEEFKGLFSNRFQVSLDGDASTISQISDA